MFHLHEDSEEWYISPTELDEIIRYHCKLPPECNLEYKMENNKISVTAWITNSDGEEIQINPGETDGDNNERSITEDPPY